MYPLYVSLSAQELETTFSNLLNKIPSLHNRKTLSELSGGLTNRNLKIETDNGTFVARISSNESDLLSIDRESEYLNSQIAASVGIGAPVIDYLPNQGLLVIGFIQGKTYNDEDVANNLPKIAKSLKILHSAPKFVRNFDMFEIQKKYLAIVKSRGFKFPKSYENYEVMYDELFRIFTATDDGKVPCNNDLLPANFIDDGNKVWLIDYEYSGNNDPCFELGNIWSEASLSLEKLEELVYQYYGEHRTDKVARAWLFALLAKYGWTLWACIQNSISQIEFDFWEWGMKKFQDVESDYGSNFYQKQIEALKG